MVEWYLVWNKGSFCQWNCKPSKLSLLEWCKLKNFSRGTHATSWKVKRVYFGRQSNWIFFSTWQPDWRNVSGSFKKFHRNCHYLNSEKRWTLVPNRILFQENRAGRGTIKWTPRYPDLSRLHLFWWGHLRSMPLN